MVVAARAEMRSRKRKEKKHLRRLCVQAPEIFSQYPIGRDVRASAQEHFVGLDLRARHLGELFEQVLLRELLFLLTLDIEDDVALVHHDEAVAVNDGVLHVVGDHHGGELVFAHDAVREFEHLGRRRGVERRGVLVEQQQLRLLQGGHEQRQRLALAAGEQADLRRHAVLKAEAKALELLMIFLALRLRDAPAQRALLAAARGEGEVLLDLHVRGRAHHGVLEHAPQKAGALFLRKIGDILAIDGDGAAIHREGAGNGIEQGGFPRAVAADDGDKIAVIQGEGEPIQRYFLIDGAGVEGFVDILKLQHTAEPPLA